MEAESAQLLHLLEEVVAARLPRQAAAHHQAGLLELEQARDYNTRAAKLGREYRSKTKTTLSTA